MDYRQYKTMKAKGLISLVPLSEKAVKASIVTFNPTTGEKLPLTEEAVNAAELQVVRDRHADAVASMDLLLSDMKPLFRQAIENKIAALKAQS